MDGDRIARGEERALLRSLEAVGLFAMVLLAALVALHLWFGPLLEEREEPAIEATARLHDGALQMARLATKLTETPEGDGRVALQRELAARIDRLHGLAAPLIATPAADVDAVPAAIRLGEILAMGRRAAETGDTALARAFAAATAAELLPAIAARQAAMATASATARHHAALVDLAFHGLAFAVLLGVWLGILRPHARRAARLAGQQRLMLGELRRLAMHDGLTGLPNRSHLSDYLRDLWQTGEGEARMICVCHVDLDRFKSVNDRYGYAAGDRVLVRVADILRNETRASDFVARVGGDEFVIVLPDALSEEMGASMARRIGQRLRDPIYLGEDRIQLGASLGLAQAVLGEGDPDGLLASADLAQNTIKRDHGDGIALYSAELREREVARALLRDEIANALEQDCFVVFFQPQIDLRSGEVTGMEALMRWDHPVRGLIGPGEFLGIAEETGLIVRIGRRVIARALDNLAGWRSAGLLDIDIGINLSARELGDRRLVDWLKWEVDMRDLPPRSVRIEMLETVLIGQADDVLGASMRALADHGFAIDLDDFGTGRSSLSNLLFLKVDRLKLDRSFICGLDGNARQRQMVHAMVSMAGSLGLEVLAEGIETVAEAEAALALGCGFGQGYWIAEPMQADAVPGWLEGRARARAGRLASG